MVLSTSDTDREDAESIVLELATSFPVHDPYPLYRRLRERVPVCYSPLMGIWVVTSYQRALEVLRSSAFGHGPMDNHFLRSDARFDGSAWLTFLSETMLFKDPPEHTRQRSLVARAFSPRRLDGLRGSMERLADRLLDDALSRERTGDEVDFVSTIAVPFPMTVICDMLGIPEEDRKSFRSWGEAMAGAAPPLMTDEVLAAADTALLDFNRYVSELAAERRAQRRDDMLTDLVHAEEAGDRLTTRELVAMIINIVTGGFQTTGDGLSNATLALCRHPAEKAQLAADPDLDVAAIEELLRFDNSIQTALPRTALTDTELGGQKIKQGERVVVVLGAATRDPAVIDAPDILDIDRVRPSTMQQLAFANGIHHCLGAALARLELQVLLPRMIRRFPDLRALDDDPRRTGNFMTRGVERLPLRLEPVQ